MASGPRSRTTARSPGSRSASLTSAAASSLCAPLDTAMATARRSADSRSDGSATTAAVSVRPVSSRTAAPSDAATRAREDRASVMILRSSGSGVTSLTLTSLRCGFVLALHQHRADLVAPAGQVLRGEPQAADGRGGARDRDPAEGVRQQPGHRLHVLLFQVDAEQLAEFGRRQPGGDPGRAVGEPFYRRLLVVVLVGDLADDLLQDVLDGDQPGG